jgi:gliding motility-associated protein GldM
MAIPKEPRQLMINLMYLVLTAMLALNVSAEIINAFFMLDKGIKHTNDIVDTSTASVIKSMKTTAEDKKDLAPIATAAASVPEKIQPLLDKIDELRAAITNEGGFYLYEKEYHGHSVDHRKAEYEKTGITNFKMTDDKKLEGKPVDKKNKDITQRLLVDEAQGAVLKEEMAKARKALLKVIDDIVAENKKNPMKGVKFEKIEELKESLVLEEVDDKVWGDAGKASWEAHVFGYMPIAACYPLFRKYQNDAKNAAAQIVNYLSGNMGNKILKFDKFDVFASSEKPYILLGETYEADISLGAFSSEAKFSIQVGGRNLTVKDGKAKFSATPGSVGTQSYKANIVVVNPLTGEEDRVTKDFKYEVGMPSATVAADKMNVLYIGVPNPITVSAGGASSNDLSVSLAGAGGGKLTKAKGEGKYSITVTQMTKLGSFCKVVLTNKKTGKVLAQSPFRVKRIPDPVAKLVNGKTDGVIRSAEMRVMNGLMAVLEGFDFDATCKIQGFTMYYMPPRQDPVEITNAGGRFQGKALQAAQSARPGSTFQFVNVKGRCPGDAQGRKLNGLAFQIR